MENIKFRFKQLTVKKEEVIDFYTQLGQLLNRFDIRAIVGICFSDDGDFIPMVADPADTEILRECIEVTEHLKLVLSKLSGGSDNYTYTDGLTDNQGAENN